MATPISKRALSGQARRILAAAPWRDMNLVAYETAVHELVLLDDAEVLQIFQPGWQNSQGSVAIESSMGQIALANDSEILIWEPIGSGRPKWERVGRREHRQVSSLAWMGPHLLVIATQAGRVSIWNVKTTEEVWAEQIGHTKVRTHGSSILTYLKSSEGNKKNSQSVVIVVAFAKLPASSLESLGKFTTKSHTVGRLQVYDAWLLDHNTVAVIAQNTATKSRAAFVWQHEQLKASIPNCDAVLPAYPSEDDGERKRDHVVLVAAANNIAFQLELPQNAYSEAAVLPPGIVAATPERVYALNDGELRVFARSSTDVDHVATAGGAAGTSDSMSVSALPGLVLFGTTLFTSGFEPVWDMQLESGVLLTALTGPKTLVAATKTAVKALKKQTGEPSVQWEFTLPGPPLALAHTHKGTCVITTHEIVLLTSSGDVAHRAEVDGAQAAHIDASTAQAAVAVNGKVEMWGLASMVATASVEFEDPVEQVALARNALAVASNGVIQTWHSLPAQDGSTAFRTLEVLELASVQQIAWSPKGDQLAVVDAGGTRVYALAMRVAPQLVPVFEVPSALTSSADSTKPQLWLDDVLALFNGRQIRVLDLNEPNPALAATAARFAIANTSAEAGDSGPRGVASLLAALQTDVPIYHPTALLLLVQSRALPSVYFLLERLASQILYADTFENGDTTVLALDAALGLTQLGETPTLSQTSVERICGERRRPAGLTAEEHVQLQRLAVACRETDGMDSFALTALVLYRVFDRRAEGAAHAWLSSTRKTLQANLHNPVDLNVSTSSADSEDAPLDVWLDRDSLSAAMELAAKAQFARTRDPTTVSLYYLALRKLPALQALWRVSSGAEKEKTVKLLRNDFATDRWRTAALKNAYALLSRHRPHYAAAFFLLGDAVTDCCQICVTKLGDPALAIAVARVYDGDRSAGLQRVASLLEGGPPRDRWTVMWLQLALGSAEAARAALAANDDPLSVLLLKDMSELGDLTAYLAARGVPQLLHAPLLVRHPVTLEQETAEEETTDTDWGRPLPSNLKAAPTEMQLEPDMSAFGF